MKCLAILVTFLWSCESLYFCENITFRYLSGDLDNPGTDRNKSKRIPNVPRRRYGAPTTCYLHLYKELLLSSTMCTRTLHVDSTNWTDSYSTDNQLRDWNKNFASPDCGAKIVKSSSEAKNAGHLISKSMDEYMLTECSNPVWFIVELCETIKVERIELEDHELYAGSPHHVKLSVAHKYATNSRSWIELGNFTASGEKKVVEKFDNPMQNVYGKFVKVDILSHYGEEHYCTLTSLRVFGVSEYEILSEEDQGPDPESRDHPVHVAQSSVEDKLREISIMSSRRSEEVTRNLVSVKENFRYLYLHLRKDTCVDTVTLNLLEKTTSTTISTPTPVSRTPAIIQAQSDKEIPKKKEDDINKKESILVQLNTRVKQLEKNATMLGNLIRNLNLTASVQSSDMERILEAVIKAKELFKESNKDNTAVKMKLKQLVDSDSKFEEFMRETSQTIKVVVFSLIFLSILIIHHACSVDTSTRMEKVQDTRDISTMTESPAAPLTVPPVNLDQPRRADRRTTWCGGSQGNLAHILDLHRQKARENKAVWRRVRELREGEDNREPTPPVAHVLPPVQRGGEDVLQQRVEQIRTSSHLPTIPENIPVAGVDEPNNEEPPRSSSPLTLLLEGRGGVGGGRRRVTWCGAGCIPSARNQQG